MIPTENRFSVLQNDGRGDTVQWQHQANAPVIEAILERSGRTPVLTQ